MAKNKNCNILTYSHNLNRSKDYFNQTAEALITNPSFYEVKCY